MSDSVDLPGLIVPVEARIDKLERGLKRAADLQAKASRDMEARAKQSATKIGGAYDDIGTRLAAAFGKFTPVVTGFLGGMAGGLVTSALGSITTDVRGVIGGIADMADEADRVGLLTDQFQALQYGMKLAGVEQGEFNAGLEKFAQNIGDASRGQGTFGATLQANGIALRNAQGQLRPTNDLLRDFADLVQRTPDEAARMSLVAEAFGRGGKAMTLALEGGSAGLTAMTDDARNAGAVIDSTVVAKARELDDRFDALSTAAGTFFKTATVEGADILYKGLAGDVMLLTDLRDLLQKPFTMPKMPVDVTATPELEALTGAAQRAQDALAGDVAALLEVENTQPAALVLSDLSDQIAQLTNDLQTGKIGQAEYQAGLVDLIGQAKDFEGALADVGNVNMSPTRDVLAAILGDLQALVRGAEDAAGALSDLPGMHGRGLPPEAPSNLAPDSSPTPGKRPMDLGIPDTSAHSGGSAKSYDQQIAKLQEDTRALNAEAAALIATAGAGMQFGDAVEYAREKATLLVEAQKQGLQVTPELTAQIEEVARAHVMAGAKVDEATDKLRKMEEASKNAAETLSKMFVGILDGSMTAEDALKQLVLQLLEAQLQAQLTAMFTNMIGATTGSVVPTGGGSANTTDMMTQMVMSFLMLSFDEGGYTGDGRTLEPAGVVHRGEFVLSKRAVQRIGVPALEGLHDAALRGYAAGGLVGSSGTVARAAQGQAEHGGSAGQSVTINAPVTVNGSAGTPEQNADLAQKIAREMERNMRAVVQKELIKQARPGNMLAGNG